MTIDAGAVLALTGTGSFYGKTMSRGLDLAAKHIEAAGGPKINLIYLDHKSGDAAAGKAAITELGSKNVPAKFASYADDLGVMLDGTAQYKIFTLDGGGGTSIFAQGKPYFWGTRAITPNDPLPGLFQYTKDDATRRQDRRASSVWDLGEPNNGIIKADILKKIAAGGYTHNGLYELRAGRQPGLLAGAAEDQGQRARHPARRHLRPGPRVVRQPGGHRRPEGRPRSASSSRPTA